MTQGDRIKGWREFRRLTRSELATRMGVSRQTIRGWEVGEWKTSEDNEIALAAILGIPRVSTPTFPDPPKGAA